MFHSRPSLVSSAISLLILAGGDAAIAQSARSGGNANAQLMQQMQQLASERTALQAETTKLKSDLEAMRKDRDALKTAQQAWDRRAKSSEESLRQNLAQRESSEKELTQTKEKMQQLIAKFKETIATLRALETEHTTTKQTLVSREQELKVCVDRNFSLYRLNDEILAHFEHQSTWSRVAQAEPFTKIKRVQLENLVDEYKGRADEQRVSPPAGLSIDSAGPPAADAKTPH